MAAKSDKWLRNLLECVKTNNLSELRYLLETRDRSFPDRKLYKGDTPLHFIARMTQPISEDCLHMVLSLIDVNLKNNDGKTALHEAAIYGNLIMVQSLIQQGANVNILKIADWTPLMLACTKQNIRVVSTLVEAGASLQLRNKDGWTAFHIATREGCVSIMRYLLEVDSFCADTISKTGRIPLHTSALHGHLQATELLLSVCGDGVVNSQDNCGSTPIMDALRRGHTHVCDVLVREGASLTLRNSLNQSLVHVVAESGQVISMTYLLDSDSTVDVNMRWRNDITALHLAAKEGHAEMTAYLLDRGADLSLRDTNKRTALMIAEMCKKDACIRVLQSHNQRR